MSIFFSHRTGWLLVTPFPVPYYQTKLLGLLSPESEEGKVQVKRQQKHILYWNTLYIAKHKPCFITSVCSASASCTGDQSTLSCSVYYICTNSWYESWQSVPNYNIYARSIIVKSTATKSLKRTWVWFSKWVKNNGNKSRTHGNVTCYIKGHYIWVVETGLRRTLKRPSLVRWYKDHSYNQYIIWCH